MPQVSIVIPLFNDEEWVEDAVKSCMAQTCTDIEIICVDDASTDNTTMIVNQLQKRDQRIALVKSEINGSAFQARRIGVEAARAPYIMFLDGDDTLSERAVKVAADLAKEKQADVVGFGVKVLTEDGRATPRFERSLQPQHAEIVAPSIVSSLFPVGEPAQGHLWKYLFSTDLLTAAYSIFPRGLRLSRANDIPVTFVAMSLAQKYVSSKERLYNYRFRRGTSGQEVSDIGGFEFYLGAVDSIDTIAPLLSSSDANINESVEDCFHSARLSIVGNLLRYCVKQAAPAIRSDCLGLLIDRVGLTAVVRASSTFFPEALELISTYVSRSSQSRRPVKNVLVTAGNLRTGGVQGVVAAQCGFLVEAGYNVTVVLFSNSDIAYELPLSVRVVRVKPNLLGERVDFWIDLVRQNSIDAIVDHHIFYNDYWPYFVLGARSIGVPTYGWLHNFSLRPLMDFSDRSEFLTKYLPILRQVVVLSATDVAYWKLRGIENVCYLPNPPSPFLNRLPAEVKKAREATDGPIRIVWWGRLQQSTKQVRELVKIAQGLSDIGVEFHMKIVGPDGPDLSVERLRLDAKERGVRDYVSFPGPLHGRELLDVLLDSDIFVSTRLIEGYPLTFLEAQTVGLPIVMYELPWLALLEGNEGVVAVRQGDYSGAVDAIVRICQDPLEYSKRSIGAQNASERALSFDFGLLYSQLLEEALSPSYSPAPTVASAGLLMEWSAAFANRNVRIVRRERKRHQKEVASLRTELGSLTKLELKRRRRISALEGSLSFRVGRVLTAIPRSLRSVWWRIRRSV